MAEQEPILQVDSDWKRQAQEEKRRLAEERAKAAAAATPPAAAAAPAAGATTAPSESERSGGEDAPPSFSGLVHSLVTQVLFSLGLLAERGTQPSVNLDSAKHLIDTLGVLEDKTRGNLTPEEQQMLQSTLYDLRMRYVSVASRYIV